MVVAEKVGVDFIYLPCVKDEKLETQRRKKTHPRSHSELLARLELDLVSSHHSCFIEMRLRPRDLPKFT